MGDLFFLIPRVISGFYSVALYVVSCGNVGSLCRDFAKGEKKTH